MSQYTIEGFWFQMLYRRELQDLTMTIKIKNYKGTLYLFNYVLLFQAKD